MRTESTTDLGDLVIVLLASTPAGLRDRLVSHNFTRAAELVALLTPIAATPTSQR